MEPKTKMVSFRLSTSEYAEADEACRAHGYRSISLYARYAILAFHPASARSGAFEDHIGELRQRIDTMAQELIRISAHVGKVTKCACPACAAASGLYQTAAAG